MKVLLDENLPRKLKADILHFQSYTVTDMGWNSKKNGELLKLMLENNFSVLITFDQNIEYHLFRVNKSSLQPSTISIAPEKVRKATNTKLYFE